MSSHSSGKTIYGQKYQKLDQHSVSGPKTKLLCGFISASLPSKSASFEIYQSYQRIITSYTINVNGVNGDWGEFRNFMNGHTISEGLFCAKGIG